jgi:thiamine transporter ThiT
MKLFLKHATDRGCVILSIQAALVVGTLLALINHYEHIFRGTLTKINIIQILLTYLVPYSVATFGSAMQARRMELQELKLKEEYQVR